MRRVKSLLPLLLCAVVLSACNTLANRRDLYSPIEPDGPYTKALDTGELPTASELEKTKVETN